MPGRTAPPAAPARQRNLTIAVASLAVALAAPGLALADGYLSLAGVTIPASADPSHPGWLELTHYQLSENATQVVYGHNGRRVAGLVTVTRNTDAATPAIMGENGHELTSAVLDVPSSDGSQLIYTLTDVIIINYHTGGSGPGQETFEIGYQQIGVGDALNQVTLDGVVLRIPPLLNPAVRPTVATAPAAATNAASASNPWLH